MVLLLFSYLWLAPSTLGFTIQWIFLSKPRLLQMSFGGREKKGKNRIQHKFWTKSASEFVFLAIYLSLRLKEACTHAWEKSSVIILLHCSWFAFCLSIYWVKFPVVCQAGVRLSVISPNFQVFLGALSFVYFAKALAEGYLKSTITQIERRFDIPSSLVGVIDGSFEIGRYCRSLVLLVHVL